MIKIFPEGQPIWADRNKVHKQGRATRDLQVYMDNVKTNYLPMVQVYLKQADVSQPLTLDLYPYFWIDTTLCVESTPVPTPIAIGDEAAGVAFVTLIRWIASLFK